MRILNLVFVSSILFSTSTVFAFDHTYKNWNTVLKENVKQVGLSSQVNYLQIKKTSTPLLTFVKEVESVTAEDYQKWSNEQKLAFLFNAYNALTIKLILDHTKGEQLPKSIKDIGSLFKATWKIKFFRLFGQETYLDFIEHEIARKNFSEPRLHFAFNCASVGCPALLSVPFNEKGLDSQLTLAAKNFLSDKTRNYYDSEKDTLFLSSIFKWYREDFDKSKAGSLVKFVATYMDLKPNDRQHLLKADTKVKFLDYDWSLNSIK